MYVGKVEQQQLYYNNCFALCSLEDANPAQYKGTISKIKELCVRTDARHQILELALREGFQPDWFEKKKAKTKVLPGISSFPSFPPPSSIARI
jgi:hypothetical protein